VVLPHRSAVAAAGSEPFSGKEAACETRGESPSEDRPVAAECWLGHSGLPRPEPPQTFNYSMEKLSMKKLLVVVLLLLLLEFSICPAPNAAQYTREIDLPPVKISYEHLTNIIEKAEYLLEDSKQDNDMIIIQMMQCSFGSRKYSFNKISEFKNDKNLPPELTHVSYEFYRKEASISQLEIELRDSLRTLKVSGNNVSKVDALFSSLQSDFYESKVMFGGSDFRSFAWFFGINPISISLFIFSLYKFKPGKLRLGFVGMGISLIIYTSSLYFPYDKFFPGFAAYKDSVSIFDRYAGEISFTSLVVGVVGLISAFYFPQKKSNGTKS
jgi:hypothetical protein